MKPSLLFGAALLAFDIVSASDQSYHAQRFSNAVLDQDDGHVHIPGRHEADHSASFWGETTSGSAAYLKLFSDALAVMQNTWFGLWIGTWPSCNDWTAAVVSRYMISALESLHISSRAAGRSPVEVIQIDDQITGYFDQTAAFYFGENAFALRNEANDDALWVVLNWLEAIRFATSYSSTFRLRSGGMPWHGVQYTPAFAHRARIFYDIASKGWNTTLCGGGMIWNNRLEPYKNAITNQLYISASTEMYLTYPGDNNKSPFIIHSDKRASGPLDRIYLDNAIETYRWLEDSKMLNTQGLYVDGFHITGYRNSTSIGTGVCDARNEMVYTYNQGVILTGSRNLWESTGEVKYLTDAHALVRNVIRATGWEDDGTSLNLTWAGIGRAGILEEFCDESGTCTQDGQTFKGIFMEHLAHFCQPLPLVARHRGRTYPASRTFAQLHLNSCRSYAPWVEHNAKAANSTRNAAGQFGMWWGAEYYDSSGIYKSPPKELPHGAIDYVNDRSRISIGQRAEMMTDEQTATEMQWFMGHEKERTAGAQDPNDRGRGRTVETQGGGLAVLRAAWEFSRL